MASVIWEQEKCICNKARKIWHLRDGTSSSNNGILTEKSGLVVSIDSAVKYRNNLGILKRWIWKSLSLGWPQLSALLWQVIKHRFFSKNWTCIRKLNKDTNRFLYFPYPKAGDDIDAGIAFKNFKKCLNKCWGEYEDKVNNLPILNAADNDKYDQLYKDFESCVSSRCKND